MSFGTVNSDFRELNRFPRMMQEYLTIRLQALYKENSERIMNLKTREDVEAYQRNLKQKIKQVFGEMPERTPLNIQIAGECKREFYTIYNITFDSKPGFTVTANIYRPVERDEPLPAVLCLCGHDEKGKACESQQAFAQTLARMGYITLIFDPIGVSERLQYPDHAGNSQVGNSVYEHNMNARQQILVGEWIGKWFIWDCIRALDVLLLQEGVDHTRVGVTGNSGGGNMTAYMVALDERITMSAPSCWITSWYHNGVNEEPIDAEQCPPGILGLGLEQADLIAVQAPKPSILITQEQDFFDQRGSEESFKRLRHIYKLFNAEENLEYYVGSNTHGYWQGAREAMYAFFNRHAGLSVPSNEPELIIEDDKKLQCTTKGQVAYSGSKSIFDFTLEKSHKLAQTREIKDSKKLKQKVERMLKLPFRGDPPDYRILRPWTKRGYARPYANQFVIETELEPGVQVIVTKLEDVWRTARPQKGKGRAALYLPHLSSDIEMREDKIVRSFEQKYQAFFACDYRGIGESLPDTCRPNSFYHNYGSDYHYASYALMLGESYVSWRVGDVLRTLDWMTLFDYDKVHLIAKGQGAIIGALVALMDDRIRSVTLINAPGSYTEMAETKLQQWPLSAMLPHVLEEFDLPDIYRALNSKGLCMIPEV